MTTIKMFLLAVLLTATALSFAAKEKPVAPVAPAEQKVETTTEKTVETTTEQKTEKKEEATK